MCCDVSVLPLGSGTSRVVHESVLVFFLAGVRILFVMRTACAREVVDANRVAHV